MPHEFQQAAHHINVCRVPGCGQPPQQHVYVCELCGHDGWTCAHSLKTCVTCTATVPGQPCFGCGRVAG